MSPHAKMVAAVTAFIGTGVLCPLSGVGFPGAVAQTIVVSAQPRVMISLPASDTAVVRLHISGMTCGSCPVTARLIETPIRIESRPKRKAQPDAGL